MKYLLPMIFLIFYTLAHAEMSPCKLVYEAMENPGGLKLKEMKLPYMYRSYFISIYSRSHDEGVFIDKIFLDISNEQIDYNTNLPADAWMKAYDFMVIKRQSGKAIEVNFENQTSKFFSEQDIGANPRFKERNKIIIPIGEAYKTSFHIDKSVLLECN